MDEKMEKIAKLFEDPFTNRYIPSKKKELCPLIQQSVTISTCSNFYSNLKRRKKRHVIRVIDKYLQQNGLKSNWDDNLFNLIWDYTKFKKFTITKDIKQIEYHLQCWVAILTVNSNLDHHQ